MPTSLLPPLPVYDDVTPDLPPPTFEEARAKPADSVLTSIIPPLRIAVLNDPECNPIQQQPPPTYTSVSNSPAADFPTETI
ncbi:unnamed protein product [Dibothriocephalus latus]|uniref:Uncharacterized protein n=1 Tax=Dibothriocephalus latus TaxID=60516 RepID=A0A3P7PF78_DIBLA|nr:unnamed protein product [Dibothriocephalus latus]